MKARKVWTAGFVLLSMVAAVLILAAFSTGCRGPYDAAWRTLDSVQKAKHLTAQQMASAAKVNHDSCVKANGPKTAGYATCIKPTRVMLQQWKRNVRPAVNSAVSITATALTIAEKTKADPKVKWLVLLRPAVCALARAVRSFGHYYADKGAAVLGVLKTVEGVTCE